MRLTGKLCAQHLGWTFKKHWRTQGQRVIRDTGAAAELEKLGITVKSAEDALTPKPKLEELEVFGCRPKEIVEDTTHPDWQEKPCHIFSNHNVLLEGLPQAQLLTKTITIEGFPSNIEESMNKVRLPNSVDRNVQNLIKTANIFDAEQVKLPKVVLLDRPGYNLPRVYGISQERRNRLLVNKLISECEKLSNRTITSNRRLIDQSDFKVTLSNGDDLLQFNVNAEKMVTSARAIEPVKGKFDGELPNLHPLSCTISLPTTNIYKTSNFYPLRKISSHSHPHTIFINFNKEFVGNLHETSVTTSQFQSRTLLKAFTVAAARAKQLYEGAELDILPKPIVVQSIQTDGRTFHFGIFQLNSLNIGGSDGLRNYWFHQPNLDLFKECGYKAGKPNLDGYNKDVFRYLNAFYNNF